MSFKDKVRDWLIEYEHVPPSNVVWLNTPHARANARQMALSTEEDREATRREHRRAAIRQHIDELQMANGWAELDIARRNDLIASLRVEDQLLEVPRHV